MRVILKKIRKMWEMKHMIENDWDKIRENRINQECRRILNKILDLPNDELMYEMIHAVLSEMLKIIGKAYMIEK